MTLNSWLKKIWNGRSKGVSTVIGTVFLMLIIFMVSTNVLLWTFSQNADYNQAVMEKNQEEADRRNENIVTSDASYSVDGDKVKVKTNLTNAGSVAVQIINLWVFDTSIQEYNYTSLNLNLNPGNVTDLTGSNAIMVTINGASSTDDFTSWFVTARGNTIPLKKEQSEEQGVIRAEISQGIGSVAFNFSTFRYYTCNGDKLENYPVGNPTFKIPWGETIAFGFNLTNFDPTNQTITFDEPSLMWSYFPVPAGQRIGPMWYIVNVNPDRSIDATYSPISLAWGESKLFVFAKQAGNWETHQKNKLGAINLLLYGTFEDRSEYAQNIPFVSIYAYFETS